MMQVQFFLFGLLLVWFIGTGKLAALMSALASTPAKNSESSPGVGTPLGPGTRYPWDPVPPGEQGNAIVTPTP
jgi:hypothetical protein